jgi:hypothetical protein
MIRAMARLLSFGLALGIAVVLVGCGSDPSSSPAGPATASVTQGRFTMTFTVEQSTVRSSDEITGTAQLALLTPGGVTFSGPDTLIGFEFSEVAGNRRHVIPVFDAVCAPHRVTSTSPLDSPIVKSGAIVEGSDANWYRQFLTDPVVKLPAGDWDITALAGFNDGQSCTGQRLDMRATVRVHVTD